MKSGEGCVSASERRKIGVGKRETGVVGTAGEIDQDGDEMNHLFQRRGTEFVVAQ